MKTLTGTAAFLMIMTVAWPIPASAQELGSDAHVATLLFVMNAGGMSWDREAGTLTLEHVSPVVTFFSDRPERIAGHARLPGFLRMWNEGDDSFKEDPPNANLSVFEDGNVHSAVLELFDPRSSGEDLTFRIKILDGSLPGSGGASSLFIDGLFSGGAGKSGLRGAALGALGGAIAGDTGKGAAIGAAVGVIGGAARRSGERAAAKEQATTRVINVPNKNGSFTPVTLHLGPNGWQGPKGEVYPSLPTADQLREAYAID